MMSSTIRSRDSHRPRPASRRSQHDQQRRQRLRRQRDRLTESSAVMSCRSRPAPSIPHLRDMPAKGNASASNAGCGGSVAGRSKNSAGRVKTQRLRQRLLDGGVKRWPITNCSNSVVRCHPPGRYETARQGDRHSRACRGAHGRSAGAAPGQGHGRCRVAALHANALAAAHGARCGAKPPGAG